MQNKVRQLVYAALIAAVYAAITVAIQPISSGLLQVRLSEALCVLPVFTAGAVPGLFVGCVLANVLVGAALPDIVFGSLATLLAAALTYALHRRGAARWLIPLPAVVINAVVVGLLLHYVYQVGAPLTVCMAYVAGGQILSCYGLGIPLWDLLKRLPLFQ